MALVKGNTTIDYALEQGKKYDSMQIHYLQSANVVKLALLEQTTSPHLGSIIEGLESNTVQRENAAVLDTMKSLDAAFNKTLAEYQNAYNAYMTKLLSTEDITKTWQNKNIYGASSGGYGFNYVNRFGYVRNYSDTAWNKMKTYEIKYDEKVEEPWGLFGVDIAVEFPEIKPYTSEHCPLARPNLDTQSAYLELQHGGPMGIGEPCGLEGTNVRNSETGVIAWLSPEGVLHHYPDNQTWKATQKSGGCPDGYTDLTNETYSSMRQGPPMNSSSKCDTIGLNSEASQKIKKLNDTLLKISNEMYKNVLKLEKVDTRIDTKMSQTKHQLKQRIVELNKERAKFNTIQTKRNTLQAEIQDNELVVKREYLHYLAWTLGAITVGFIAFRHVTK